MTSEVGSPAHMQSTVEYSDTRTRLTWNMYDTAGILLQDLVLPSGGNNNVGAMPYTNVVRTAEISIPVF
jgi:hypothetical protein